MRPSRLDFHLLLLVAFLITALAPLSAPGYFMRAHDARHSVYFLQMFDMTMRDGAWYPRWAADMVFGYGYPLWLLLPPLPFFLGQAFHLVGFDLVSAVKLADGLAFFCSALTMYLFAGRILGKNAGLVAAVAYAYVPYHLVDLYVRAAQAELVAFAFPPLVFWAFYQLATTRQMHYIPVAALAYAGLVLAHVQTAFLFTPIIGLYILCLPFFARPAANRGQTMASRAVDASLESVSLESVSLRGGGFRRRSNPQDRTAKATLGIASSHKPLLAMTRAVSGIASGRKPTLAMTDTSPAEDASERPAGRGDQWRSVFRFLLAAAASVTLALGLAAIFLLPILLEQRYLTSEPLIGGTFDYRKHFVSVSQLFSPFWGYGYAGENGNDQFSLQLGLAPVALALVAISAWRRMPGRVQWHVVFFFLAASAGVLATLPWSRPLWEPFAGIAAFLQFPWRWLVTVTFGLAFLSGAALHALPGRGQDILPALLVALVLMVASFGYTRPEHTEAIFDYQTQMEFQVKDKELLGDTVWVTGQRPVDSPLVPQYVAGQPLQKAVALDDGATVTMLRHGGQSDEVLVDASVPARIMFYTRYFPGWAATLDGMPIGVEPYGEQGLILVNVPAGKHNLRLAFQDTWPRQAGAAVSATSLLIALALWRAARRPA